MMMMMTTMTMMKSVVRMAAVGYALSRQGESNSLAGCPVAYACLFPALIADWRAKFALPQLSFVFVQLAACEAWDSMWAG